MSDGHLQIPTDQISAKLAEIWQEKDPRRSGWNLAIMARFWLESGNNRWILAVVVEFHFSPLVSFFYESNVRKYFRENHFFYK
jgi:hypothetical protein